MRPVWLSLFRPQWQDEQSAPVRLPHAGTACAATLSANTVAMTTATVRSIGKTSFMLCDGGTSAQQTVNQTTLPFRHMVACRLESAFLRLYLGASTIFLQPSRKKQTAHQGAVAM